MKVRVIGVTGTVAGHYGVQPDDVIDVAEVDGADLIAHGYAVAVEGPKRRVVKDK